MAAQAADSSIVFTDLPDDVGALLLVRCDVADVASMARVCRTTNRWTRDLYMWQQLFAQRFPFALRRMAIPSYPVDWRQCFADRVQQDQRWRKPPVRVRKQTIADPHVSSISSVQFDQRHIVTSAWSTIYIFDRTSDNLKQLQTISQIAYDAGCYLTDRYIATCDLKSNFASAVVYDRETLTPTLVPTRSPLEFVRDVYVYDHNLLTFACYSKTFISVSDIRSRTQVAELYTAPHIHTSANSVRCDAHQMLIGTNHNAMWLYDNRTWQRLSTLGEGLLNEWVWDVDLVDGCAALSCGDGSVTLWNTDTMKLQHKFAIPSPTMMKCIKIDDSKVVCGRGDCRMILLDRELCPMQTLRVHDDWVRCIDFDGTTLMSASDDGTLCVVDFE
jgi:WD40 repeat protein